MNEEIEHKPEIRVGTVFTVEVVEIPTEHRKNPVCRVINDPEFERFVVFVVDVPPDTKVGDTFKTKIINISRSGTSARGFFEGKAE